MLVQIYVQCLGNMKPFVFLVCVFKILIINDQKNARCVPNTLPQCRSD